MSANSSSRTKRHLTVRSLRPLVGYSLWVIFVMMSVQIVLVNGFQWGMYIKIPGLLNLVSTIIPLANLNAAALSALVGALVYTVALAMAIGVPWWWKKRKTTRTELGIDRLPEWKDIGLAPLAYIPYLLLSGLLLFIATKLFMDFDGTQTQDVGFEQITRYSEYLLAFVTLVIMAPLAEETLFRGYLYGKLRPVGFAAATVVTSLAFGFLHGQWNVALDVFALSLVLCTLREVTGSIWAGVLLHTLKNGIAFFVLFNGSMLLQ